MALSPAARLAARIEDETGPRAAAAWVHVAALAAHAAASGIAPPVPPGDPVTAIRAAAAHLASAHPALSALADPAVVPVWDSAPAAGDAARILDLWRGADLADPRADGYVIGDLYQELSAEARKGRALCQTPRFVTGLLLDLSWDNAVRGFGPGIRMIDPACGTGHILIEALIRAGAAAGDVPDPEAFAAVHGADIDPCAALIARYRILAAACRWGGRRLALRDIPAGLPVQVACADSLLSAGEPLLQRGQYHAVVANPPYITCKDAGQGDAIRSRYKAVCSGKFSLAVPFEPLMHELCVPGGWVARITANSFMKREFGKKLIEDYFPTVDLRWVIDTSGAYIPGHGTPTVILASRNQPPSSAKIHAVLSVRGEPSRPADPAKGVVWTEIARAVREREAFDRFAAAAKPAGALSGPEPAPDARVVRLEQASLFEAVA